MRMYEILLRTGNKENVRTIINSKTKQNNDISNIDDNANNKII